MIINLPLLVDDKNKLPIRYNSYNLTSKRIFSKFDKAIEILMSINDFFDERAIRYYRKINFILHKKKELKYERYADEPYSPLPFDEFLNMIETLLVISNDVKYKYEHVIIIEKKNSPNSFSTEDNKVLLAAASYTRAVMPLITSYAKISKYASDTLINAVINVYLEHNGKHLIYKLFNLVKVAINKTTLSDSVFWNYIQNDGVTPYYQYIIQFNKTLSVLPKVICHENDSVSAIAFIQEVVKKQLMYSFIYDLPLNYRVTNLNDSNAFRTSFNYIDVKKLAINREIIDNIVKNITLNSYDLVIINNLIEIENNVKQLFKIIYNIRIEYIDKYTYYKLMKYTYIHYNRVFPTLSEYIFSVSAKDCSNVSLTHVSISRFIKHPSVHCIRQSISEKITSNIFSVKVNVDKVLMLLNDSKRLTLLPEGNRMTLREININTYDVIVEIGRLLLRL